MLKHYLLSIYRSLIRNKWFSFINILGLAIGFAAFLVIAQYVLHESTYDHFQKDSDQIYRMSSKAFAMSSVAHANYLESNLPGIEFTTSILPNRNITIQQEQDILVEKKGIYVTNNFFNVFENITVSGDIDKFSTNPQSVVITENLASRLFNNNEDAIGKTIQILNGIGDNSSEMEIIAVTKNLPSNSYLSYNIVLPFPKEFYNSIKDSFGNTLFYSFIKTSPNVSLESLTKSSDLLFAKLFSERRNFSGTPEEYLNQFGHITPLYINIKDIHLNSNLPFEWGTIGNKEYLYIFSGIALFIIVLACINYINLTISQSSKKAKDVSVRKAFGSNKKQLTTQYITESLFTSLVSLLIAFLIVELLLKLPFFSSEIGLESSLFDNPLMLFIGVTFVIITGLLAGLYPSIYMASFNPIKVIKGFHKSNPRNKKLISGLVVFQFTISIVMILFAFFVKKQLMFGLEKDLGYSYENILIIDDLTSINIQESLLLRDELQKLSSVNSASLGHFSLIEGMNPGTLTRLDTDLSVNFDYKYIDEFYFETMDFELVNGRNFYAGNQSDRNGIIINETTARELGLNDPIGIRLKNNLGNEVHVLGVVKDFHYKNLLNRINPAGFMTPNTISELVVKLNSNNDLGPILNLWSRFSDQPMQYHFFESDLDKLFESERLLSIIINIFTAIAIFIASLGILGLVSLLLDQKTKEIGIRKVLGASVLSILTLISKNFIYLVSISLALAIPISFIITNSWLEDFAYKIEMSFWPFLLISFLSLAGIFFLTGYQSIKAALANPINSLKDE